VEAHITQPPRTKLELYTADPDAAVAREIVDGYNEVGAFRALAGGSTSPEMLDELRAEALADRAAFFARHGAPTVVMGMAEVDFVSLCERRAVL